MKAIGPPYSGKLNVRWDEKGMANQCKLLNHSFTLDSNFNRNPDIDYVEDNWAIDVMTEERVKGYLSDSIKLLKDQAMEAKKEADNPKEGYEGYNKGELMVYCSLFSLLRRQASVFNIDAKELGLVDIEHERDLI